jgi:single-strand DNA-binding protein
VTEVRQPPAVIVGTICREDPVLKFTPNGLAVCEFSVRVPGKNAKDGQPKVEAEFHNVTAWRELGENVAECLHNGDRVIVRGVTKVQTWQNDAGEEKSKTILNAWNVGPDLSYATASVVRNERKDSSSPAPAPAPQPTATDYGEF